MESILERIQYGLQFSPSTINYISSKRSSKKTQKKVDKKHLTQIESGVFQTNNIVEINT